MSAAFVAATMLLAAACGGTSTSSSDAGGPPVLRWEVGPERADVEALARTCSESSGGAYRIEVERTSGDLEVRHASLMRRLLARDDAVDLFSMDPAWSEEMAAAQVLAPVPEDLKAPFAQDVAPAALRSLTVDGLLVAAPWTFDPWMLWWRGNAAERAGLDTTKPISWDALLTGAETSGRQVLVDDPDGEGAATWVNALLAGSGGTLLEGTTRTPQVGLATSAGRTAASVTERVARLGAAAGPSTDAAAGLARRGGFVVAPSSFVSDPELVGIAGELQWAPFPQVGAEAAAPASGVALAVPLYARDTSLSYQAISCLTSDALLASVMTGSGHGSPRTTVYDLPAVETGYPLTDVVRPSLDTAVVLPATPFWMQARAALDDTWTPFSQVDTGTPRRAQQAVRDALGGRLP